MSVIRIGIIGSGGIALANHMPGLRLCPEARRSSRCATATRPTLAARQPADRHHRDVHRLPASCSTHAGVDAVVIATPNVSHAPIALAAVAGRQARAVREADRDEPRRGAGDAPRRRGRRRAAHDGVHLPLRPGDAVHAPPGRLAARSAGRTTSAPSGSRTGATRNLGWRQVKKLAGTGELGDMLSPPHRLRPPARRPRSRALVADTKRFLDDRGGQPSDLDDWVAILADFESGATGVLESTKLATGRGEGHRGQDLCEVNGREGTIVYSTQQPTGAADRQARRRRTWRRCRCREEFLVLARAPRATRRTGDPLVTFRYDQDFEFIDAIREQRPCRPVVRRRRAGAGGDGRGGRSRLQRAAVGGRRRAGTVKLTAGPTSRRQETSKSRSRHRRRQRRRRAVAARDSLPRRVAASRSSAGARRAATRPCSSPAPATASALAVPVRRRQPADVDAMARAVLAAVRRRRACSSTPPAPTSPTARSTC